MVKWHIPFAIGSIDTFGLFAGSQLAPMLSSSAWSAVKPLIVTCLDVPTTSLNVARKRSGPGATLDAS